MWFKRKSVFMITLALIFQLSPTAQAAPNVVFDGLMTGCPTLYNGTAIYGNRLIANTATTITGINVRVGTGLNSNWSTTKYWITSYNSSTDRPGVILETFTANSNSGSGADTVVNFTGSYTLAAGTKFYVFPNVTFSTFPVCYSNSPPTANLLPNLGVNVDTTTTLSNATWTKAFISALWPGANSLSWSINNSQAQLWALSLETAPSAPVNVSLMLAGASRTAIYRTTKTITATVDTAAYVTFYSNGRKIAGCINVLSTAGTANCAWKPSTKGSITLTALARPISGSYIQNLTSKLDILVSPRLLNR